MKIITNIISELQSVQGILHTLPNTAKTSEGHLSQQAESIQLYSLIYLQSWWDK